MVHTLGANSKQAPTAKTLSMMGCWGFWSIASGLWIQGASCALWASKCGNAFDCWCSDPGCRVQDSRLKVNSPVCQNQKTVTKKSCGLKSPE